MEKIDLITLYQYILITQQTTPMAESSTKPLIKWVGGKTQICDDIISKFPPKMKNYHEPFVGGGSILIRLLEKHNSGVIKIKHKIYASDVNESLIGLYKNVQQNPDLLFETILSLKEQYFGSDSREQFYYEMRTKYNTQQEPKDSIMDSALLVFLNKTCFRGLYRVGPNGFNVPYGNNKNPEIINKEHLMKINRLVSNSDVVFSCCSFEESLQIVKKNDFVYLDPPYAPENPKSFVGYNKTGFSIECHERLFELCHSITNKKAKIMMSNSDVEFVKRHFIEMYNIETIECKRKINSKNPDAKTKEIIIVNF